MKVLFIHPNMPGQYKHLARVMGEDKNNQIVFITKPKKVEIPGVTKIEYDVKRDSQPEIHRYIINFERGILRGQEIWRVCKKLKESGFVPDVICGHLGWGEGLFLKDIYHDTPILSFLEFFYDAYHSDAGFYEETELAPDECARIRMKNALHLFNLTYCDWGITPTFFQLNRHPKEFQPKISVLHDGVDTDAVQPDNTATITLPNGTTLSKKDEVVTYISRNFEPYRGFPSFMYAAEKILKNRPNCHIIIVGGDGVSYGKANESGKTYRQEYMEKVNLDPNRFHHLGYLPYDKMVNVMQVSSAHIYLTVPFVLSWSMLEAMSAGCLLIGSNTEPIEEVIQDGQNGLIVDFFDADDIAAKVDAVFSHKDRMQEIRNNARKTAEQKYALNKLLPLHVNLVKDLAQGNTPPPTHTTIQGLYEN